MRDLEDELAHIQAMEAMIDLFTQRIQELEESMFRLGRDQPLKPEIQEQHRLRLEALQTLRRYRDTRIRVDEMIELSRSLRSRET